MVTMTQPVSRAGQIIVVNVPHRQSWSSVDCLVLTSHPTNNKASVLVIELTYLKPLHLNLPLYFNIGLYKHFSASFQFRLIFTMKLLVSHLSVNKTKNSSALEETHG